MAIQPSFVETVAQLVPGASVIVFGAAQTYGGYTPAAPSNTAARP